MPKVATMLEDIPMMPPSETPEGRESQLISLAMDYAERAMREGTASSQIVTHFLKRGCIQAQIELEKLELEKELLRAKTEALESQRRLDDLYSKAMEALREYRGEDE